MTETQDRPDDRRVPGGAPARWTVGEKYGFTTLGDHEDPSPSRVWFTLTEGALTEARFPRLDLVSVRLVEFVVSDPDSDYAVRTYRADRRRPMAVDRSTERVDERSLRFQQTITNTGERDWTVTIESVPHTDDAALVDVDFTAEDGTDYDIYVVVDPALGGCGSYDDATVDRSTGTLTAVHDGSRAPDPTVTDDSGAGYEPAVALAADDGFDWASVDVVGGDRYEQVYGGAAVTEATEEAFGNVALIGRVGSGTQSFSSAVALGFAENQAVASAQQRAASALEDGIEAAATALDESWHARLDDVEVPSCVRDDDRLRSRYYAALLVMTAAEAKQHAGGGIASPAIPWGDAVAADDPADYGYGHVWARDLYHSFTAFEAAGDLQRALEATEYLYETQSRRNGFVPQNTFLDGEMRWSDEQLDQAAFPAVMAAQLARRYGYEPGSTAYDYRDVADSADYLATRGPWSEQERWEEEAGYSPSTIAAGIAGLVSAGWLARQAGERADALAYAATADYWRAGVDQWTVTETGTPRADDDSVPRYVRVSGTRDPDRGATRTHRNGGGTYDERRVLDGGFLELVRLGVKPADDPVVETTLDAYDDDIRVDTPHGPAWYRYTGDGYGEKARGSGAPWAVDSIGKGRLWPFLTGERAEYELLAGTETGALAPRALLETLAGFANDGDMFPEQVWDREDDNEYGWQFGGGTSAATPLSWTCAQYVRLAHSIDAGEPVERPALVAERYLDGDTPGDGPALDVDVSVDGTDPVATVSGRTDAAEVVVKTNAETVRITPDGAFERTVRLADGRTLLVVAADGTEDPLDAATTLVEHRHRLPESEADTGTSPN